MVHSILFGISAAKDFQFERVAHWFRVYPRSDLRERRSNSNAVPPKFRRGRANQSKARLKILSQSFNGAESGDVIPESNQNIGTEYFQLLKIMCSGISLFRSTISRWRRYCRKRRPAQGVDAFATPAIVELKVDPVFFCITTMTVVVKNKEPFVIPPAARRMAGFKRGQELEVKASAGVITIVAKLSLDEQQDEREIRDPKIRAVIRKGHEEFLAGKTRPAERLLAERNNGVLMRPKRVLDPDDTLTPAEAKIVRRGLAQLKRGESKPWRDVKHALSL